MQEKVWEYSRQIDPSGRVLVVGTTSDYIQWIRTQRPGQAVFLTDPGDRAGASEPAPLPVEEIVCDLNQIPVVRAALRAHLREHALHLQGVACFDCDSMELAALLADFYSLPFPALSSVRLCRDKFLSKQRWRHNGVSCPAAWLVHESGELSAYAGRIGTGLVLKPRSGTGSQLVFFCRSRNDLEKAFKTLEGKGCRAAEERMVLEELIDAPEYSCDCVVYADRVEILRVTAKIMAEDAPAGTVRGYHLTAVDQVDGEHLAATVWRGAHALGLSCGICMVDFLLRGQEIVLLEMTPRPGGDCLPHLLRQAGRFDVLSQSLDVARSCRVVPPLSTSRDDWVALRLHASEPGFVESIDTSRVAQDPRVVEIAIDCQARQLVLLPPDDYTSWYLGHLIFRPFPQVAIAQQCRELRAMVDVRMA